MAKTPPEPDRTPLIGHTVPFVRGEMDYIDRTFEQYGDLVRFQLLGMGAVNMARHPDQFEAVLLSDAESFEKTEDFAAAFGQGLLTVEGDRWRRQRTTLNPFFRRDRLLGETGQIHEQIDRRLALWTDGESRDIEREMKRLTLDILFAIVFGRELAVEGDEPLREASNRINDWFASTAYLALPDWVPTRSHRRFERAKQTLRSEAGRLLDERAGTIGEAERDTEAADGEFPDLLSVLAAEEMGDDADADREELLDQFGTFVFAGHETSAMALTYAWYLLATHPDVRERFHEELTTVLDGDVPTAETIDELTYTRAILDETLRLYPPIYSIPRQTAEPVELNGYEIPAGERVHLSVLALHRDERWYDDPLTFRPSRWLDDEQTDRPDLAYAPFGAGPRLCIGRTLALLEGVMILATIGQRYRLEWSGDRFDLLPCEYAVTMRPKPSMEMRVEQRESG